MQNIGELDKSIDSLTKGYISEIEGFAKTVYLRSGVKSINRYKDSQKAKSFEGTSAYLSWFSKRKRQQILNSAKNNIDMQLSSFSNQKNVFFIREKVINLHRLWRDDKFVTAYAALLLFFVGAPLGAIIRKGGFGLPIVVALTIFLTYHFAGTLFKNSAEDGSLHPFWGSWLITIILTAVGLIATIRASKDKSVFDIERLKMNLKMPLNLIAKKWKR
jgi:lipopolysaccharide export system permease protein